ncbi:MAG TPA: hypothetical protein VFI00_03315, partial [Kribbella sp.]|nr:hypothetical protein [Kribbella sp.]
MKRLAFVVGTAVVGLSALTACSSNSSASSSAPSTPSSSAPATPSPSAPAAGSTAALSTASVGNFGKIVVDGTGRTLYVYDLDTAKPSKSNCYGSCAALWPPLLAGTGTPMVSGVSASLVGTVSRTDGTKQVTLAGHPLYYYAGDTKAG